MWFLTRRQALDPPPGPTIPIKVTQDKVPHSVHTQNLFPDTFTLKLATQHAKPNQDQEPGISGS